MSLFSLPPLTILNDVLTHTAYYISLPGEGARMLYSKHTTDPVENRMYCGKRRRASHYTLVMSPYTFKQLGSLSWFMTLPKNYGASPLVDIKQIPACTSFHLKLKHRNSLH